ADDQCAENNGGVPCGQSRGSDGGSDDGGNSESDSGTPGCNGAADCASGQECVDGVCVCTPTSCASGCCQNDLCLAGTSTTACGTGGVACEACDGGCVNNGCGCAPGTTRTIACGNCGTQAQFCSTASGSWTNDGGCVGSGVCSPGTEGLAQQCGGCGFRFKTCTLTCTWSSSYGSCSGVVDGGPQRCTDKQETCGADGNCHCGPGGPDCGSNQCCPRTGSPNRCALPGGVSCNSDDNACCTNHCDVPNGNICG
ncbi:MAG: hypothetical protein ACJ790_16635, partial [Myxococcaceae bacterium]